ncbi:MAG: P-loop NTPase family protein [Bacilli bacterium]
MDDLQLNVPLLRRRVPNLTTAARAVGLRSATVSNLCTGKIPVSRAEVRTLVTLAALAGCSLDELIIRGGGVGMLETGIKVLDLFAPLVRGGTVGFVARLGMGQLVLLAEVFHRMKLRGFATVLWATRGDNPDLSDVEQTADAVCGSLADVQTEVARFRAARDVLLAADRRMVLSGELFALRERLQEAGARPLTTLLVDTSGEAVDEEAPYGPLDTFLRFDMDLAARGLFPAVDPVVSTSTLLEGTQLEASHALVQQQARKTLRRYRELRSLVSARGLDRLPAGEVTVYRRGERLEAFLTQPFYVAEEFTNRPGESVSLVEALDGVRRILEGAADDLDVAQVKYIGLLARNDEFAGNK